MSDGEIIQAAPYHELLESSREFQDLVNAHKETAGSGRAVEVTSSQRHGTVSGEIKKSPTEKLITSSKSDQLIKQEEREVGDRGLTPYKQYLGQDKGFFFYSVVCLCHLFFVACQISQNTWMAANVDSPSVSTLRLIVVYLLIGLVSMLFLLGRSLGTVSLGMRASKSLFSQLIISLFRAPMSFYDSTPLGRILSRVSIVPVQVQLMICTAYANIC